MTQISAAKRRPPTSRCPGSRHAMKCYEFFLKKIFQHPAFPFWMTDVSPIRSYISGYLKPFIPTATAAFLLFAPSAASFAAEPQTTPIPEIHRVADIFQPLSRPAELLLEPTHLVLSICCGIFSCSWLSWPTFLFANTPENLHAWLNDSDSLKLGYMPVLRG